MAITEAQVRQLEEDGAICLRGVVSADWIDRLRAATERVSHAISVNHGLAGDKGKVTNEVHLWFKDEEFRAFVFEGPCADIARVLLRSSAVRLFNDHLFIKEPGTSTPTPWHHDQVYWPLMGDDVCGFWIPMDKVTKETGGLEYVRGSHRWGRRFTPVDFGTLSSTMFRQGESEPIPDFDAERDKYEFVSWDLEPGDCLVHLGMAVHGAGGNHSKTVRRRAFSVRMFGERTRFRPTKLYTLDNVGLEDGALLNTPVFPKVPRDTREPLVTPIGLNLPG